MSTLDLPASLRFDFFLVTAPGMVPDTQNWAPRIPGTLIFPNTKKDDGSFMIRHLNGFALKAAFDTEKEANTHMLGIHDGSIVLETDEKEYSELDITTVECKKFRAEFFPIRFEKAEIGSLKFHGAMDMGSILDYGDKEHLKKLYAEKHPQFKAPPLPRLETEDGENPVLHEGYSYKLTSAEWDRIRAIHPEQGTMAFANQFADASSAYHCGFHGVAEEVGKQILVTPDAEPDIVVYGRFYTTRDTYPSKIVPEAAVTLANIRQKVQNLDTERYNEYGHAARNYVLELLA